MDIIFQLLDDSEIAKFVYRYVIIISGYIVLSLLIGSGLLFNRTIIFMSSWFVLIVLAIPPKKAIMDADPFDDQLFSELDL